MLVAILLVAGGVSGAAVAQTGPGGVGNGNGSASNGVSQPENLLWLKASELGFSNGDDVGTWADSSGNGHDFLQSSAGQQPVYRDGSNGINGQAILDFDGSDDRLVDDDGTSYLEGLSGVTAFFVVESDQSDVDHGVFATQEPNTRDADMVGLRYDRDGAFGDGADVMKFVVKTEPDASGGGFDPENENVETNPSAGPSNNIQNHSTNPRLYRVEWASGENAQLFTNGFQANIQSRNNEGGGGLPLSGTLSEASGSNIRNILGQGPKDGTPNAYWDGKIAEVVFYGQKLNDAQHKIVESYLETRYDFETETIKTDLYGFDSSHPVEVAGVGQASSGDTHLKAASSVLGIDASGAGLSNGEFLLYGHDGNLLSFTTSERPNEDTRADNGSNVRKLSREWKADLTGASSQTVAVDVDLSSLTLPAGYNDYAVFVDDDGDFTSGATFYDLDSNGQASGVTIGQGDYVTVAAIKRTITFDSPSSSDFENAGGNAVEEEFAPPLNTTINYPNSTSFNVGLSISEDTGTLVEDTDGTFGNEGPANEEDWRQDFTSAFVLGGATSADLNAFRALNVYNDSRDAETDSDESPAEDLIVTINTITDPFVTAGGTTSHTFTILDDDDDRKVSFSGAGSKPIKVLGANPEEGTDTNANNQSDSEDAVTTVNFEVALPEGIEGSVSTFATFEVTGASTDDFEIPANGNNNKLSDRRGEVQVNNTQTVNGKNTGYGTFDLTITDDAVFENDETLTITLVNSRSGTLDNSGNLDLTYTILNDDNKPEVEFVTAGQSDDESVSSAIGTLELSGAAGKDLDVAFTVGGTATAGSDYTQNTSSPVTIGAGKTKKEITFSVIDDSQQELTETIDVSIDYGSSDPAEPSSGNKTFTYSILDNDNIGAEGPGGVGDLNALQLWLRAEDGTDASGNGDPVGQWADQSGNGNDFTQSGSQRPTLQTNAINGRPSLQFNDSNNEFLNDTDGNDNYVNAEPAFSVFTVSESNEINTESGVFIADTDSGPDTGSGDDQDDIISVRYDIDGSTEHLELGLATNEGGGTTLTFNSNDGTLSTDPQLLQYEWGSGSTLRFFVNGTNEGSASPPSGGLSGAESVAIGRTDGGQPYWDGRIAETVLYTATLNRAQRQIVQNYLSAKYDVPLNTSGSAKDLYTEDNGDGDPSNGGDYDLRMIGVGQASDGTFHSRARGDGLDLKATGGLNNGDFAMAGHRVPRNSVTTDGVGGLDASSGDNARSRRAWAVSWTDPGNDLTVDLTFDLSSLGFKGVAGAASNYKLIVSNQDSIGSGQSYSWSTKTTASSVDGPKITFSGLSLSDGHYYTLATTNRDDSPLTNKTALVVSGRDGNEGNANANTYGSDAGWRQLGVPVEGATAGDISSGRDDPFVEFNLAGTKMMYTWDDAIENASTDGNWSAAGSSTAIPNGRGFILFFFDDEGTSDADPIAPDAVLNVPDSKTPPGNNPVTVGDGTPAADNALNTDSDVESHLLANPYTVPYDLTSLVDGRTEFQNTVQIWDGGRTAGGSYLPVIVNSTTGETAAAPNGDVIAPWQGFFVERNPAETPYTTDELTFSATGRTAGARSIIGSKSTGGRTATEIKLRLVTRDETDSLITRDRAAALYVHPEAENGWDTYDASKFVPMTVPGDPWATIAPIGSNSEGTPIPKAVESRSPASEPFEVPLQLRTSAELEGTMTISAPVWQNVPADWTVRLVDTKRTPGEDDDTVHKLRPDGDGYSFSYENTSTAKAASISNESSQGAPLRNDGDASRPVPRTMTLRETGRKSGEKRPSTRFALRISPGDATQDRTPRPVAFARAPQATVKETTVLLKWSTTVESSNYSGFAIEHRRAGTRQSFSDLGYVERKSSAKASTMPYRYEADSLADGEDHEFRLLQVNDDGTTTRLKTISAQVPLQQSFTLSKSHPNPFRRETELDLKVRTSQTVTATVYDILGRRVKVIHDGPVRANETVPLRLDGRNLSSGLYLIRVRGEDFSVTRRAVLRK